MDWNVTKNFPAPAIESVRDSRLASAAHQFEASMMNELMKPLMENSLFDDTDPSALGGQGAGGSNALTCFACESFARSLSEHGGLGIARQIIARLRTEPNGSPSRSNGLPKVP
jgi:Rod binding domain-containing protein